METQAPVGLYLCQMCLPWNFIPQLSRRPKINPPSPAAILVVQGKCLTM